MLLGIAKSLTLVSREVPLKENMNLEGAALLRDVARVPKEVVGEAEVAEASPVDRSRSTVVDNRWYCINCQTANQIICLIRWAPNDSPYPAI